ncbi:tat pathway signal sequence [Pseudomassariella vexata]|uniref:Tat pathway signal sequence n=1 Tax=Pseudomassariella vexata TaxID=1141098 RepID=A0A1Y2DA24_9PEZI|nr:tat pathway signal sequence [Pseudomassariella vexata]ORY56121.1 tat pathway signal sequence [Pseudomassariella vexata]
MGIFTKDPNDRNVYGIKFKWTPEHLTPEDLHPLIYTYDRLTTEAVERLDELVPPRPVDLSKRRQDTDEPMESKPHRDTYKLIQEYAKTDETVGKLRAQLETIPEWVDWDQIERGQKVFWRYGGAGITALTYLSLLGGMGSGRTVETLDRTGGFAIKVVRRRLLETTQHTLSVHRDLDSIKPGGQGYMSSIRVRLLHTSVRRRILALSKANPGYYDVEAYGVPINDLDCIGTINTFSATLIWIGWPRQGIYLREQEIVDYLALWRYVAYLMGTPHDWLATPNEAKKMMESLLVSEIKPTRKSVTLAHNIITGLEGHPPTYSSRGFQETVTYWLLGRELARDLGIEKPTLYYNCLAAGQCLLFMVTSYVNRSIPSWDERNIRFTRKLLYEFLVRNKSRGALGYEARFSLKWVPNLVNMTTPLGIQVASQRNKSGISKPGIERSALFVLIFACAVVVAGAWVGVSVARLLALTSGVDLGRAKSTLVRLADHMTG